MQNEKTSWWISITIAGVYQESIPGFVDETACKSKWQELRTAMIKAAAGTTLYAVANSPTGQLIILEDQSLQEV